MNLYINCTETFKFKQNTGIQRVVRKIAQISGGTSVYFDGIGFLPINIEDLAPEGANFFIKSRDLILKFPFLAILAKSVLEKILTIKSFITYYKNRDKYVRFKTGDIILSADSVRKKKLISVFRQMKIPIYQIVYDILPITYPQFFKVSSVNEFKYVSSSWLTYSTKILTISEKVSSEIRETLQARNVEHFYLGADFTNKLTSTIPTKFQNYFLAVGTIEPRKNHIHILKTFLKLWKKGSQEKLVFIGRKGWNFKEIIKYINEAQISYPQNFLWLDDLDDQGLESYYHNSKAVICASIDEGFGLPIIESLSHKKNVLCSDIEVFREIGKKYCTYFNFELEGQGSLLEIIKNEDYQIDISDFKWLTWQESVDILINKIIKDQE